ncbi:HNH endonuclease, partial [Candidatus Eisenbacteria bacterium]
GEDELVADGLVSVVLRFSPTELARYEAQIERLHKSGVVDSGAKREEIVLSAQEALLGSAKEKANGDKTTGKKLPGEKNTGEKITRGKTAREGTKHSTSPSAGSDEVGGQDGSRIVENKPARKPIPRGTPTTNYKIIIYRCSGCQKSVVKTDRGPKRISPAEFETIRCDAVIQRNGRRSRSAIPPGARARVLARDQHRCQTPGCTRTRFLEIHHVRPVSQGGSNRPENLTTLCSGCHRLRHSCGRLKRVPIAGTR